MNNLLSSLYDNKYQQYYRYILLDFLGRVDDLNPLSFVELSKNSLANDLNIIERPDIVYDKTLCPRLVCIGRSNQKTSLDLLQVSIDQAKYEKLYAKRYVCGWIVSEHPPHVVAEQIVEIGTMLGQFLQRNFIPFYEPFRMQLLDDGNNICPKWLLNVLGVFEAYSYADIYGQIRTLIPQKSISNTDYIFISDEAKFYEKEAKAIFYLFLTWFEIKQSRNENISADEFTTLLNLYRQAASKARLSDINDRFVYVIDSLKYGSLESHSKLKHAIQQASEEPGCLSELFSSFLENEFLSILETKHRA